MKINRTILLIGTSLALYSCSTTTSLNQALIDASLEGNSKEVERILKEKRNLEKKSDEGETALFIAVKKGHVGVVKLLLEEKADVNTRNKSGWTPLMKASEQGSLELTELLLSAGADRKAKNENGADAFMIASGKGHQEITKVLQSRKQVPSTRKETAAKRKGYVNDKNSLLPSTTILPEEDPTRVKIRSIARALIGKKGRFITIGGKKFPNDCSGMVRGVYSAVGVDLLEQASRFKGMNGVKIIYNTYKENGWSTKKRLPRTGDLIFFNNTYDMNKNGKWDDYLTHVALVTGIEEDGTVVHIHHVSRGVQRYRLNLNRKGVYKDGKKPVNDFLRRRPKWDQDRTKYLSENLFYRFINVLDPKVASNP